MLPTRSGQTGSTLAVDTDAELVRRVQDGDTRAFDMLFDRYKHRIHSLVSRFVDTHEDIEEIVQESFIKAYKAMPRFRGDSQFYTWLYRIAANTAKNYLASRSRRPATSDIDIVDDAAVNEIPDLHETDNPENILESHELEQIIKRAIQELEPELKSAVTLREYAGLSYEQIAEIMDCPVGTVRSRIFRAREAIATKMRAREGN